MLIRSHPSKEYGDRDKMRGREVERQEDREILDFKNSWEEKIVKSKEYGGREIEGDEEWQIQRYREKDIMKINLERQEERESCRKRE